VSQPPEFLKVKEVMERLRVSRFTADRLIREGVLRSVRIGRRSIRVVGQSLDEFIATQTRQIAS